MSTYLNYLKYKNTFEILKEHGDISSFIIFVELLLKEYSDLLGRHEELLEFIRHDS